MKVMIPVMPLWLSVILLIVNIFLPGIGTIIAGFCVLCSCCDAGPGSSSRFASLCANFWIGLLQLVTALFLIGWIWAIFWGILFVTQSMDRGSTTVVTMAPQGSVMTQTTRHTSSNA